MILLEGVSLMGKKIAYCGIDCCKCPTYIATVNEDDLLKMKTSIEWSRLFNRTIVPRQIHCTGCKSEGDQFENCKSCRIRSEGIRKEKFKSYKDKEVVNL